MFASSHRALQASGILRISATLALLCFATTCRMSVQAAEPHADRLVVFQITAVDETAQRIAIQRSGSAKPTLLSVGERSAEDIRLVSVRSGSALIEFRSSQAGTWLLARVRMGETFREHRRNGHDPIPVPVATRAPPAAKITPTRTQAPEPATERDPERQRR